MRLVDILFSFETFVLSVAYKLFTFLLQIWDAVPKPHAHKETPLSEFFDVKIMT